MIITTFHVGERKTLCLYACSSSMKSEMRRGEFDSYFLFGKSLLSLPSSAALCGGGGEVMRSSNTSYFLLKSKPDGGPFASEKDISVKQQKV